MAFLQLFLHMYVERTLYVIVLEPVALLSKETINQRFSKQTIRQLPTVQTAVPLPQNAYFSYALETLIEITCIVT